MIDIHCHILPTIDDGPATIDVSLEMCRIAEADGIDTIVATPHFNPGIYETKSAKVFELIDELETRLNRENIRIRVLPGAEVIVFPGLVTFLKREGYLSINRSGRYVLVEFPPHMVPPQWEAFLLSLLKSGLVPIISHPERNAWFMNNPEALYQIVRKGVMVQITAMSLTGEFGEDIQRFSIFLLEHDLAHVIATDAHSPTHRPPLLKEAVKTAEDIIGKERANALVTSVPASIIAGREVKLPVPVETKKKVKTWVKRLIPLLKS